MLVSLPLDMDDSSECSVLLSADHAALDDISSLNGLCDETTLDFLLEGSSISALLDGLLVEADFSDSLLDMCCEDPDTLSEAEEPDFSDDTL